MPFDVDLWRFRVCVVRVWGRRPLHGGRVPMGSGEAPCAPPESKTRIRFSGITTSTSAETFRWGEAQEKHFYSNSCSWLSWFHSELLIHNENWWPIQAVCHELWATILKSTWEPPKKELVKRFSSLVLTDSFPDAKPNMWSYAMYLCHASDSALRNVWQDPAMESLKEGWASEKHQKM